MNRALLEHFERHFVLDVSTAEKLGVSRATLAYLAKSGALQRLSHGVYALASEVADELVAVAARSPWIVFSHETALALHRLHNRIPDVPSITLPEGKRVPHSIEKSVTVHHARNGFYDLGLTAVKSFPGHAVPCYDAERTICDVIRSYSRIDEETYVGALRNSAKWPERNPSRLFGYAQTMGIEDKVHRAMEALL